MANNTLYTNIHVEDLGTAEIRITGDILEEAVKQYRPKVMQSLQKDFAAPGFRKGHVPEKLIVERLGEPSILSEVAELVLQNVYAEIIAEKELSVIGRPTVVLTKCAPGNPIGFAIQTAILPPIKLPDYVNIAQTVRKKVTPITVTKEEIDSVIEHIQRGQNTQQVESGEALKESEIPALTDEFVRSRGDFKDVADFKQKLKENIHEEKERKLRESKRIEMGEKIIDGTTMTIPRILIESELEKMIAQFKGDIERMGTTFNDYLAKIDKTEDIIRAELEGDAEKRARLQLILNKIASEEKISPDPKAVEHELEHLREHVGDIDQERARIYIETILSNEAVFRFLENCGSHDHTTNTTKDNV